MIAPLAPALPPSGAGALAIVPEQVIQHYRNAQGWGFGERGKALSPPPISSEIVLLMRKFTEFY
jgi:hypothetical protein